MSEETQAQEWQRISADGSISAYNEAFDECYHSLKDGALNESLHKHIYPALWHIGTLTCGQDFKLDSDISESKAGFKADSEIDSKNSESEADFNMDLKAVSESTFKSPLEAPLETSFLPALRLPPKLTILDICFGLGYNSLLLLSTLARLKYSGEVHIYSPELDCELFSRLLSFSYPLEVSAYIPRLHALLEALAQIERAQSGTYCERIGDFSYSLTLYKGDALEFLSHLEADFSESRGFDMIFQDAFSPKKNPALWSEAYFTTLSRLLKPQGIITTYSQARVVREAAHKAGLYAYDYQSPLTRTSMLFAKAPITLPMAKERKLTL